jgi:hypothetical protein
MNTLRTEIFTSPNAGPNAGRSNRLAPDLIRGKEVRVGGILKMLPSRRLPGSVAGVAGLPALGDVDSAYEN